MGSGFVQTLKGFLSKHPPLLVFISCLVLCGLAAITLAFLVEEKELPNPDVTDWNKFLEKLVRWNVCRNNTIKADLSKIRNVFERDSQNLMASMAITWKSSWPTSSPAIVSENFEGLPSHGKEQDLLHVTMHIPVLDHNNKTCTVESCIVTVPVCLTFTGSLNVLPNTRKPQNCLEGFNLLSKGTIFYWASQSAENCSKNDLLQISYVPDPDLTVMLTYRERSLVNVHLMHTGYFILIVAFTMFFSILLRDHFRSTARTNRKDKVPPEEMLLKTAQYGI